MNVVDLESFALNMVLNTVKIYFHVLHLAMQNKMPTLICGFKIIIGVLAKGATPKVF